MENILVPENNESKIQKSIIQTNITNILLAAMNINYYVLMISLVSLLRHIEVKILFTTLFNSMIEESKYCSEVMKKQFNKELLMTKKDNENFKNSTKRWICDNGYIDNDVKVRDHCQITGKHRGSAHRDCNINLKLNHKILVIFHNLKNYDSHLIMQQLGKLNLKIRVIPNGLEKYMSFTLNNKLSFIDSFNL